MACNFPYILYRQEPFPHLLPVPCNKCECCRKDTVESWCDRIAFESLTSSHPSSFVTLTYNDEHLPASRSPEYADFDHFIRTFRKKFYQIYEKNEKFRYFCSTEYGDLNYRPHFHLCMTNCDCYNENVFTAMYESWQIAGKPYGMMTADGLLPARIRYCVSYINDLTANQKKVYEVLNLKPLWHTMSKGIGSDYILSHKKEMLEANGYYADGRLKPLPYYYRKILEDRPKYQYLETLNDYWKPYNDRLRQRGIEPIDPFQPAQVVARGLLDQYGRESKRTRLQVLIGDETNEIRLQSKKILKQSRKSLIC